MTKNNSTPDPRDRTSQAPFISRIKPGGPKMTKSIVPTVADLALAFGGAMLGSAFGWHSIYLGPVLMYAGQYSNSPGLTAAGAGLFASVPVDLMASGGANLGRLDELAPEKKSPTVKERIKLGKMRALAFKDAFARKMFLDKIFKKEDPGSGGDVDEGSVTGLGFLGNTAAGNLDQIRRSLVASAMDYQGGSGAPVNMLESDYQNDFTDLDHLETTAEAMAGTGVDFDRM